MSNETQSTPAEPVIELEKNPIDWENEAKKLRQENAEKRKLAKELETKLANFEKAQSELEAKTLEEQNKYKELYENSKGKLTELDLVKSELQKYKELEEQERQNLLNQLPGNIKERHANDSISVIRTIHELTTTVKTPNSIGAEEMVNGKGMSNIEDLEKLAETDPARAIELLRQMSNK